jgi:tetratricopeptide (TPR) repeat protein
MTGKFGLALIRREANIYRSHGLSEEARDLYQKLLSSSPHLPRKIQIEIEHQLQLIELEIHSETPEECEDLSNEQIAVIKQGWSAQDSAADILSCAESFYHLGRFAEALAELKKLKRKRGAPKSAIGLIAACLIQLHSSEGLPAALDRLAGELFQDSRAIPSFHLAVAEKTLKWGRLEHARSVLRYVRRYKGLSPELHERMLALTREFAETGSLPHSRSAARMEAQSKLGRTHARPILNKIRETVNFYKLKALLKAKPRNGSPRGCSGSKKLVATPLITDVSRGKRIWS